MATIRAFFIGTVVVLFLTAPALRGEAKVEEQDAGPADPEAKYTVSPHGVHLAAVARKGSRMNVVVDGVAGPKVDDVVTPTWVAIDPRPMQALPIEEQQRHQPQPVTFCADGSHFAYMARLGQDWILYKDHQEFMRLPASGAVGAVSGIAGNAGNTDIRIQFAGDDGKHLFFAKSSFAGYELWVDGQKMPGYYGSGGGGSAGTIDPIITHDGEHFVYMAAMGTHPGDKQALIIDGKDAGYLADNLQMTADGKHLIGIARDAKGAHLLVDGKPLFQAKGINAVYVAPTGNRIISVLAHTNPDGSIGQFLLEGKPIEASLGETIKKVVFSPDGKRYAAICGRTGAEFVVVDGKKGQEYQMISDMPMSTAFSSNLSFSADSSKVGYVGITSFKGFIVINDDESDAFENGGNFLFSPDSKHVVMYGMLKQRNAQAPGGFDMNAVVFVDGKAERILNRGFAPETFRFSPDSARHAYFGGNPRDGGPIVLDGKDIGIGGLFSFSPDSKHVAISGYRAKDGAHGLFIDDQLVFATEAPIVYRTFTPDSQHLFWMTQEPAKGPNAAPGAYEFVTYVDGKPVVHCERRPEAEKILMPLGYGSFVKTPATWDVGPDGTLTCLSVVGDTVKRVKITPDGEMNLATLIADAQKPKTAPRH